jgi:hypothetical protein
MQGLQDHSLISFSAAALSFFYASSSCAISIFAGLFSSKLLSYVSSGLLDDQLVKVFLIHVLYGY